MDFLGFTFGRKDRNKNNPSASEFDNTVDAELEHVVDNFAATALQDREDRESSSGVSPEVYSDSFKDITCMPINSNKGTRLKQYNVMSRFPEISWCIDEVGLDIFHQDENRKIINLRIPNTKYLDDKKLDIIQDEFNHFIKLFNFDENGFSIMKNYIIEGECAWENVIDPNAPEKGIRALKYIPTRYYDFIKDRKTGEFLGIYFDKDQVNFDILTGVLSNSHAGAANIFNAITTIPGYTASMAMTENKIPLFWPQITYFNTGVYNYENTVIYPLIENASAPYQQLSLLQDAAVILRITRAPERLVFNIATGNMPEKKAKTMVQTFINSFKSKKVSNNQGEVRNSYDPASMLESYFFWKQTGSEGSSVSTLNSQASYDQMQDIDYFLRRILKAFKIPYTRFKEEGTAVQRKETITYEEYSFTKFIIRQQMAFAGAIKKTFITHLKLRKIWDIYNLNDTLINVDFVKPSLYELYQAQSLASVKMEVYKLAVEDTSFSKGLAMQKYLGYTEEAVKRNAEKQREEALFNATTEYFTELIKKNGPKEITSPIAIKTDQEAAGQEAPSEMPSGVEENPGNNQEQGSSSPEEFPTEEPPTEEPPDETPPPETSTKETPPSSTEEIPTPIEKPEESTAEEVPEEVPEERSYIPSVTNIETPTEYPGEDLLKVINPEKEIPSEAPKTISIKKPLTFRQMFSRLNKE